MPTGYRHYWLYPVGIFSYKNMSECILGSYGSADLADILFIETFTFIFENGGSFTYTLSGKPIICFLMHVSGSSTVVVCPGESKTVSSATISLSTSSISASSPNGYFSVSAYAMYFG